MAIPVDLVGMYMTHIVPRGGVSYLPTMGVVTNGALAGQSAAVMANIYRDAGGVSLGGHRAPVPAGAPASAFVNAQRTWSFNFLNYVGGAVTVSFLNNGVLTGPMSGCFLMRYSEGGVTKIAHVGTANSPASADSIAAKQYWATLVGQPGVSAVMGGSPLDYFTNADVTPAAIFSGDPYNTPICGYFVGNEAYAILFAKVPRSKNPPTDLMKIIAVRKMTLQPWTTIKEYATFKDRSHSGVHDPNTFKLG